MTLDLSNDEANVLVQLLDVAVKAGGLANAENGLFFVKKLQAAAQEEAKPKETPAK